MKDCKVEILNQETLNNKLFVQNQEPITEVMTFEELINNRRNERD